MQDQNTIPPSRRSFILAAARLAGIGAFLLPLQKAWGRFPKTSERLTVGYRDQLVLNRDSHVVHLPSSKLFLTVPDILVRRMQIIPFDKWENIVKAPVHFCKERSGIILERLALRKLLAGGPTNANLAAAAKTVSLAFSPVYKTKTGEFINRYNFRLHDLLAQCIVLNSAIPRAGKWDAFQKATGQFYLLPPMKNGTVRDIPKRMNWLKKKENFDKQADHILDNKTVLLMRLQKRASYPRF